MYQYQYPYHQLAPVSPVQAPSYLSYPGILPTSPLVTPTTVPVESPYSEPPPIVSICQPPDYDVSPPTQSYTKLLPSPLPATTSSSVTTSGDTGSIGIFNSPFKRFTQYRGSPSRASFPLRNINSRPRNEQVGETVAKYQKGKEKWYQAGERWGHGGIVRNQHKDQAVYQAGDR